MHLKPARRRRALVLLVALLGLGLGFTVVQPAAAHDRLVSADLPAERIHAEQFLPS